jgi:hypothetical protein
VNRAAQLLKDAIYFRSRKTKRNYNVIKRLFGEHVEPRSIKTHSEVLSLKCIALNNMHRMTNLVIMVMISASTIEAEKIV